MALKPFTGEGRFECGLDERIAHKTWAFTAVVGVDYPARLGVSVANEPGYIPIPEYWCHADSWEEMEAHADELNEAEGLDANTALRIVCFSMAA